MIIENFNSLATSPERKQVLILAEAGLAALNIETIVRDSIAFRGLKLFVGKDGFDISRFKRIRSVVIGAAVDGAAVALKNILGSSLADSFVAPNPGRNLASRLQEWLGQGTQTDLLIFLFAHGADNFLLSAEELKLISKIMRINILSADVISLRAHLNPLKGGGLAQLCYPATVINFLLGVDPALKTFLAKDNSTVYDAQRILSEKGLLENSELPSLELHETPKQDKYFESVVSKELLSGDVLLAAINNKAADLGIGSRVLVGIGDSQNSQSTIVQINFEGSIAKGVIRSKHEQEVNISPQGFTPIDFYIGLD